MPGVDVSMARWLDGSVSPRPTVDVLHVVVDIGPGLRVASSSVTRRLWGSREAVGDVLMLGTWVVEVGMAMGPARWSA
jgi:hypothetical protein